MEKNEINDSESPSKTSNFLSPKLIIDDNIYLSNEEVIELLANEDGYISFEII
jgi:hypothetical protein